MTNVVEMRNISMFRFKFCSMCANCRPKKKRDLKILETESLFWTSLFKTSLLRSDRTYLVHCSIP